MDSEVFARIRDYLADQLEVEPEKITPDSDIVNDFGADSLDVIDMITTLSDEFGVEIPDEDIETFHTVGDVPILDKFFRRIRAVEIPCVKQSAAFVADIEKRSFVRDYQRAHEISIYRCLFAAIKYQCAVFVLFLRLRKAAYFIQQLYGNIGGIGRIGIIGGVGVGGRIGIIWNVGIIGVGRLGRRFLRGAQRFELRELFLFLFYLLTNEGYLALFLLNG